MQPTVSTTRSVFGNFFPRGQAVRPRPSIMAGLFGGLVAFALCTSPTEAARPVESSSGPSSAPPQIEQLVTVSLSAGTAAAAPGRPLTLALTFNLAPGWHIYWLNPGDSGVPTAPKLHLPQGWTAGPWQFPLPVTFEQPGGLVGYGYKNRVTLLVDVVPPHDFTHGSATLTVDVSYLACETLCIPGQNRLQIVVAAGPSDAEANTVAVAEGKARLPHNTPDSAVRADATTPLPSSLEAGRVARLTWSVALPRAGGDTTPAPKAVEVYPLPPEGVELTGLEARWSDGRVDLSGQIRVFAGTTVVSPTILALVVRDLGDGRRIGHWIELPVVRR